MNLEIIQHFVVIVSRVGVTFPKSLKDWSITTHRGGIVASSIRVSSSRRSAMCAYYKNYMACVYGVAFIFQISQLFHVQLILCYLQSNTDFDYFHLLTIKDQSHYSKSSGTCVYTAVDSQNRSPAVFNISGHSLSDVVGSEVPITLNPSSHPSEGQIQFSTSLLPYIHQQKI